MRPYHPNNLGLQPYAHWRVIALAWAGKFLGIQFKIDGIPYGAAYRPDLWPAATGLVKIAPNPGRVSNG